MDEFKRIVIKPFERWYLKSSDIPEADLKTRRGFRLDVTLLVLAVVAALLVTGRLRGLRDEDGHYGADSSYYGDYVADGDKFDYIVIGAGAAGSAVSARLTLAGHRVLLVEAGGDPSIFTKMPGATIGLPGSAMDWHYDTLPNNKSCLGSIGKRCRFSRGKCLGGSTSINFMMYTRGNRQDYDFDVPGWTWNDIEPYFLKSQGLQDLHRLPKSSIPYHNTSGMIPISYFGESGNPWHQRLIEGFKSLNFPHNRDVNGESQIGVTKVLGFTSKGERVSTAKAYLERKNVKRKLKIAKNTHCTGVIIDENNVARGVTLSRGLNTTLRIYANNEVILSAGAVGTTQLLMLSGIGHKEHLEKFNIPVKSDLPVGDGMSDHVLPLINIKVDHGHRSFSNPLTLGEKGFETLQWFATRSGPLASNSLTDITAFVNTACYNYDEKRLVNDRPECEIPSLQFIYAYLDKGATSFARFINGKAFPHNSIVTDQFVAHNDESAYIVVSPVILRPESRGWMRLASSDPLVPPAITPNYLDDERDVDEMVRGIRMVEDIIETPLFKQYNASILKYVFPDCPSPDEEGYWECYTRQMTHSVHHAVGTVALGKVVDERLRVKGVQNLRVADASVLPLLPRGNTAASIIAIGERLADFLLQDRGPE